MPNGVMNVMGSMNQHWGVCGFTSTFYAMHALSPSQRPHLANAGAAHRVLAEIKTYLVMLKAEGSVGLLAEIEKFTSSFEGFEGFTVDGYIQHVNTSVSKTEDQIKQDEKYSIAMPPDAVADYVTRVWGKDAKVHELHGSDGGKGDGIIGVTSNRKGMVLYDGLEHYVYRHSQKIYSWGQVFDSVAHASKAGAGGVNWRVCRLIEIMS